MDQGGVNHCSSMAGSTNATSIQGTAVSTAAPATNQVLAFNGSQYVPTTVSSGSGNVVGPTASNVGDIATFMGNTGTTLQDSGVNIDGNFLGGAWINMPSTGPSGIGTGGDGATLWLGLSYNSSEYFVDSIGGDIAMRNKQGSSIRLGIDNGSGSAASVMDISALAVTLTQGVKMTGTHGGLNFVIQSNNLSDSAF